MNNQQIWMQNETPYSNMSFAYFVHSIARYTPYPKLLFTVFYNVFYVYVCIFIKLTTIYTISKCSHFWHLISYSKNFGFWNQMQVLSNICFEIKHHFSWKEKQKKNYFPFKIRQQQNYH